MADNNNMTTNGSPWTEKTKKKIWNAASKVPGYDELVWRRDRFGLTIKWSHFGNRNSALGWEIARKISLEDGGNDDPKNLYAINWYNNAVNAPL